MLRGIGSASDIYILWLSNTGVGYVAKMGEGTESSNVKLGQRVGIKWISGICHSCPACQAGKEGLCFNQKVSGYDVPGTFQQYVCSPADYVTPIPDGVESAEAAPMCVRYTNTTQIHLD